MAPWLVALALVLGLLVLIPARRLRQAGLSPGAVGAYITVLWVAAALVAARPVAARILVPLLLLAYLAPFIVSPDTLGRLVRRRPGPTAPARPPMRNVTPPEPPWEPPPSTAGHDDPGPGGAPHPR